VPEAVERAVVAVVPHLDEAVLHAEGVGEVLAGRMSFDLRRPAVQILAVEEADPALLCERGAGGETGEQGEGQAGHGGRPF
jgi:hypothetical protein